MKKVLFISWDGPQTSYMEGLFLPIFKEVNRLDKNIEIHVLQFTWATHEKIESISTLAKKLGIAYCCVNISRKPNRYIGSFVSVIRGRSLIKEYIRKNNINIIMPRSTMPAIFINSIKTNKKILFDADGLAIEERVDFAGLSRKSCLYKFYCKQEKKILIRSSGIITRSEYAIEHHIKNIGEKHRDKFSVVQNGRDIEIFSPNDDYRLKSRKELNYSQNDIVFVYAGSLGNQYGWNEMMSIFEKFSFYNINARFLILTGDKQFAHTNLKDTQKNLITILSVPFAKVSYYLNSADYAFAIREPKNSMRGVSPIKLGEYLLIGLPVIASAGIGDTEQILKKISDSHILLNNSSQEIDKAVNFLIQNKKVDRNDIRSIAVQHFSLKQAAINYITAINRL